MDNLRLKKLVLSGFKSFAKNSVFDFPQPITAIVGPNGSGKSNVAEAMRWVLGEQSLKSLRGRKGEDLIFNGSPSAPRLNKASAIMYFDNSSKQFPVEFEEVAIGRRVYRDGQSEYLLNDSLVRLKDIIELLGNVGLGVSQHHIIGQGEADRILYASSKDRQQATEDALGLKVYQFKRQEAERKLGRTEENMRQASALQKEVGPHLKHLERLVEKYKQSAEIKKNLESLMNDYLSRFGSEISKAESELSLKKSGPALELADAEKKIIEARKKLQIDESVAHEPEELKKLEEKLSLIRENKAKVERDLGRLEGMLEALLADTGDSGGVIPKEEVEDFLRGLEDSLSSVMDTDVIEEIHTIIQEIVSKITSFLSGFSGQEETAKNTAELSKKKKEAESVLLKLAEEEKKTAKEREKISSGFFAATKERRLFQEELFRLETRAGELKNTLGVLELEQEKIKLQKSEFERELADAERFLGEGKVKLEEKEPFNDLEREKTARELGRLKFRLEEAGGVDAEILKEYNEIKQRDEFFSRELEDLGNAARSLRQVSKELGEKIEEDFNKGIEKINKEFQKFFETMFGGGRAKLIVLKPEKRLKKESGGMEKDEEDLPAEALMEEGGLDIDVSLPRKKIRGLDMLSGGERALTSIALLFAMSAVNPPPFLVLDETDAALDESNSRRYGAMIKDLSRRTQIITITHNRETMRQAGALYGITTGSDGVSRMLSLKLSEAEEIAE